MQQVTYANGKLWGALDTALNPTAASSGPGSRGTSSTRTAGRSYSQGYLGATEQDFTYPAIGVTPSGRGMMAFTYTGATTNPSAAYASIDAHAGVGDWNDVPAALVPPRTTVSPSYKAQVGNPPRTRWGDYGAAAVDGNPSGSRASTSPQPCDYTPGAARSSSADRRQPARHLWRREPRPGHSRGPRQLVDAHQPTQAVTARGA